MKEIENICDQVLKEVQEKGGRISAVRYQQLVKNDEKHFRAVKMKLLALGLIDKRDDNKIILTEKGLKVRNIKETKREPWTRSDKIALGAFLVALLSMIISIIK